MAMNKISLTTSIFHCLELQSRTRQNYVTSLRPPPGRRRRVKLMRPGEPEVARPVTALRLQAPFPSPGGSSYRGLATLTQLCRAREKP
jgi:hypothetical protein